MATPASSKECAVHHVRLSLVTEYDPDTHADVDPSEEWVAFSETYSPMTRFPYALPWFSSWTRTSVNSHKVKRLYCPECQKELDAVFAQFDKQWKRRKER